MLYQLILKVRKDYQSKNKIEFIKQEEHQLKSKIEYCSMCSQYLSHPKHGILNKLQILLKKNKILFTNKRTKAYQESNKYANKRQTLF
jgi:ribosome-binding ATPase YchF (GTP1/OBG family)